ncbi:MAG: DUF5119 domain-containing protein [Bacteroidales bacterium]
MKQFNLFWLIALICCSSGCQRQELYDSCKHRSALIPVRVDWSKSGIDPYSGQADDFVHRVSFRFFPKNGNKPFELYLEGNVSDGAIEVPTGDYDVMIMNESVTDVYWHESVYFRDINSFERIHAEVYPDNPSAYDFYKPSPGERFMLDVPKMASWSIRDYSVTEQTVNETRSPELLSKAPDHTLVIPLRRLTHDCRVIATVKNLRSAQLMRGAKRGFANKVYLSSRTTHYSPATFFFTFNGRKPLNGSKTDGTTEKTFRTFGALPQTSDYSLGVDVIFVDGRRYYPDDPSELEFNITHHVYNYFVKPQSKQDLQRVEIPISLTLPEVSGDIGVGDWDDDENITIQ